MPSDNLAFSFLVGRQTCLQPYDEKDIPSFVTWENDPECRHYARNWFPTSFDLEKKWFAESSGQSQQSKSLFYCIWINEPRRLIGFVGLMGIDYSSNNCWMGLVIGDKTCWGKGYATDAGAVILDYAFGELGMHKVMVGIYAPNKGSHGVARKLGFKHIGLNKEEIFVDGHHVDGIVYELFIHEWITVRQ